MNGTTLPEEVVLHALDWLEECRSAGAGQKHLLRYCEVIADVIEDRARAALGAEGIQPLPDLAGTDRETIRLAWLNEAVQRQDCFPLLSTEHLAFTAILCGGDLREAIDRGDAEMAALSMMGLIAAAIAGGYQMKLDLIEPFQRPRLAKLGALRLALDELVKVHGSEITAEHARRVLKNTRPSVVANIQPASFASALSRAKTRLAKK